MLHNTHFRLPVIGRVALPPLVERELRGGARRPLFYWLRGLLALAAGFQGYELLAMAPAGPSLTGAPVLRQMAWLLFLVTLLMALVSAESINRERREGTLGLLLLTDLTAGEIVRGKMLACGLTSFLVLLGALPALMFPVLAGGVTGSEAAMTGIGLINTLFVALAAGLWMSTLFRERRHAIPATLGLLAALAFGPEVLGNSVFGPTATPVFRLFGLAGWMTAAQLPVVLSPLFVFWLAITHALGWVFLWRATVTLAATWQDQPHKQFREPGPAGEWPTSAAAPPPQEGLTPTPEAATALACASWLTDPRPWDADPIRWRVERLGSVEGLIWLAVALSFVAQLGTLGSFRNLGAAPVGIWGVVSLASMGVIVFSSALMAWAGARFFRDTRQQQDLEFLLTTPLGGRDILRGQWRVLCRALAWPLGLVLALALPATLSIAYDFATGCQTDFWFLLQFVLIAVNLALEAAALCWVGMRFGLRGRDSITAVAGTVGLVQLLPLGLAAALMWGWVWLSVFSPVPAMSRGKMPPVILALLFFVAKNLALIVWTRFRLRRELRLGRRTARLDAAASRLVLQRA
jgi:ABC-type transport system involved in multi-copper enzyme maturation permease subunit